MVIPSRTRQFVFHMSCSYVACISIRIKDDRVSLTYAVANLAGTIMEKRHLEVWQVNAEIIIGVIEALMERYASLKAVGIGISDSFYKSEVTFCDRDECLTIPLEALLRKRFNIEVFIENQLDQDYMDTLVGKTIEGLAWA